MKRFFLILSALAFLLTGCVSPEYEEAAITPSGQAAIIENSPERLIIQALRNQASLKDLLEELKNTRIIQYSSSNESIPFVFYDSYQKAMEENSIYTSLLDEADLGRSLEFEREGEPMVLYQSLLSAEKLPVKIYAYYALQSE